MVLYPLRVPPLFLKGEMKFPKNWVGGVTFKKVFMGNQKGKVEEITGHNWTYHTDLLLFCIKSRLEPVST